MGRKVIVVDDSPLVLGAAKTVLGRAGYHVIAVDNPFALNNLLETQRPDLVLVDVNMPGLPGDKLVEILARHGLNVCPILLYSDEDEAELARLSVSVGAAGHVTKSAGPEALLAAIQKFLPPGR